MDFHNKIMRSATGTAIDRAIWDIKRDTKRSIRNLVDLGSCMASNEVQKMFFELAHNVIINPRNPYNKLVLNLVEKVDNSIIKTVGTNFGYGGMVYGVKQLRDSESKINCHMPWMLNFDFSSLSFDGLSQQFLEELLSEAQKYGISIFSFSLGECSQKLKFIYVLAQKYKECTFFITVYPSVVTLMDTQRLKALKNVVVSVKLVECKEIGSYKETFQILAASNLLYGFKADYCSDSQEFLMSDYFVSTMMEYCCSFGIYIDKFPLNEKKETPIYSFACNIRGALGKPIVLLDWYEDIKYISNLISPGSGVLTISEDGTASVSGRNVSYDISTNSFLDVLKILMPVK